MVKSPSGQKSGGQMSGGQKSGGQESGHRMEEDQLDGLQTNDVVALKFFLSCKDYSDRKLFKDFLMLNISFLIAKHFSTT